MIIKAADLSNASHIFESFFDSVKEQTSKLGANIDTFRNDGSFKTKFKSDGYDAARNYMGIYITALNKLNTVCDTTLNNIISANNTVINAMAGYSEIDLSKRLEIEENLQLLKIDLQNTYAELNAAKKKSTIYSCKQAIEKLEKSIIEIEKYLTIIKNTEIAYNNAKGLISGDVTTTIQGFSTLIGNFCK